MSGGNWNLHLRSGRKDARTHTDSYAGVRENPLEINTDQLLALLDLLAERGVEEFEGFGFHVRFTSNLFTKEKEVPAPEEVFERPEPAVPETIWAEPRLWPGGKPPSFPK